MPDVQTVLGPVDAGDLGKTLIHEHLRGRDESTVFQWLHLHDEEAEYAEAVEMARAPCRGTTSRRWSSRPR